MDSGTDTLDAAGILAAARAARAAANAAEAEVLLKAVEWAHLHVVDDLDDAATWLTGRGQDTGIPIAGQGCPLVSEFAVGEYATALGISQRSGRDLVVQALELAHRLPKIWTRVQTGQLARARRIDPATHPSNDRPAPHPADSRPAGRSACARPATTPTASGSRCASPREGRRGR